jgi:DNA-binding NtrC family response regulator
VLILGENGTAADSHADPLRSLFTDLADMPCPEAKRRLVSLFDETYTSELLRRTDGNMSEAARRAGLDRSSIRRLLRRHKDEA